MTTTTTRLTDEDRRVIARYRRLRAMSPDQICDADRMPQNTDAYAYAFGRVSAMADELAAIAERLGGDGA